jgi:hypothetical protein
MTLAGCLASGACDTADKGALGETSNAAQAAFPGPQFPGSGSGSAGQSIAAGLPTVTCDGLGSPPAPSQGPAPGASAQELCFYSATDPNQPAATMEWIVEAAADQDLVHVRLTMNPDFVDNTYGANAIGWGDTTAQMPMMGKKPGPKKAGHTFKDLVGSDHAEFKLYDAAGALRLHFKLDYISQDPIAPSGYATLGVNGGEGKMLLGSASEIVAASTSLDRDLNACMLGSYLVDSPASDEHYTPNPQAKAWDYRVVYDVWVKQAAFGASGFGKGIVDFVHASPSKLGTNTVDVTPGTCPPVWPYCQSPSGCECQAGPDILCAPTTCEGDNCDRSDAGTDAGVDADAGNPDLI